MKNNLINIRVIEPSEGHYLTKKKREDGEDIVLSKKVYLSEIDSPDNWKEISIEEGDRLASLLSDSEALPEDFEEVIPMVEG